MWVVILLFISMFGNRSRAFLEEARAEAGAAKKSYREPEQEPEPVKTPKNGSHEQGAGPF